MYIIFEVVFWGVCHAIFMYVYSKYVRMLKKNINLCLLFKINGLSLCVNFALRIWPFMTLCAPIWLYVAVDLDVKDEKT
jgi:hypothetical protein